jgi:hypothetical protein
MRYRLRHKNLPNYVMTSIKRWRSGSIQEVNMSMICLTNSHWSCAKKNTALGTLEELREFYREDGKELPWEIEEYQSNQ